jgi:hypothetical protein
MKMRNRDRVAEVAVIIFSALLIGAGFLATWDYVTETPPFWETQQIEIGEIREWKF